MPQTKDKPVDQKLNEVVSAIDQQQLEPAIAKLIVNAERSRDQDANDSALQESRIQAWMRAEKYRKTEGCDHCEDK